MKTRVTLFFICLTAVVVTCCIDPFNPPSTSTDLNYLVIDGFLNATDGSCTIRLTRTIPLNIDSAERLEKKATIQLIDDHENTVQLSEISDGVYSISNLTLTQSYNYKLKIITKNQLEYQSDYVPVIKTPAIDSINWGYERASVPIYINTHDPENNTHYYSWSYTETWAYTSKYGSNLKIDDDGNVVYTTEDIFHCWKTAKSSAIIINSSKTLNQDIISEFSIENIPWSSPKLASKYSILVEQHALSKEAFEYAQLVKNNTENLGTLFDPLPSNITGNIHCITNPNEKPIGFFTACTIETKRIFINGIEIRKHRPSEYQIITGYERCETDTVKIDESITGTPYSQIYDGPVLVGYLVSDAFCVDCRYAGGTTIRPDFWEN